MSLIRIKNRKTEEEEILKNNKITTVHDLKTKINYIDPSSVLITFDGKVLVDSTEISTLGEDCTFVIENDIEFNKIETNNVTGAIYMAHSNVADLVNKSEIDITNNTKMYKVKINNDWVYVNEREVFIKEGKHYLIKNRTKKYKLKDIYSFLSKYFNLTNTTQFLLFSFIISSKNYPLACVIIFINILKGISLFLLRTKVWNYFENQILYAIFMFFASFIAIDHGRFIKKQTL